MPFTRRAVASNDAFEIDDLERTISAFATQDVEAGVVQLRFGDPFDDNCACGFVANRTETRQ